MKNARNNRDVEPVTKDEKRSRLVSEPNYHTKKMIFWKFISNTNKKK